VVLTAGHCVGLGDRALLVFNFEDAPDGDPLVTEGTVIEQSFEPDYALIQLDALPAATPVLLTAQASERLAIIQHPRGRPKVIAEGRFLGSCHQLVYYADLDTLVGSSGAGVLNRQGHLMGIHTDGDCDEDGRGANRGWTAEAIVEASPYLRSADIAER
jgi:Trypsin-like peptidase domain